MLTLAEARKQSQEIRLKLSPLAKAKRTAAEYRLQNTPFYKRESIASSAAAIERSGVKAANQAIEKRRIEQEAEKAAKIIEERKVQSKAAAESVVPHVSDINRSTANVDYTREAADAKLQYKRENPTRNMKPLEKVEYYAQKYNPLAIADAAVNAVPVVVTKAGEGALKFGAEAIDYVAKEAKGWDESAINGYIKNALDTLKMVTTNKKSTYPGSQANAPDK